MPACTGNNPDSDQTLCINATSCADPLATRYWLFERVVDVDLTRTPRALPGQWERIPGEVCQLRDDDAPGIGEVVAAVRSEFVRKRPAEPTLRVQPAPRVLIMADNSFAAGSEAPVTFTDTVLGLPIAITATPQRWIWDFGDGTTLTTTTPGTPGTTEVSHAYPRVGDYAVTVVVEWSGTFTVGGFTGTFPIDGVARVTSPPALVQAREARTQLVDR